jgi:hypothetical protein
MKHMATKIFVCHDTGNTNVLLAVAKYILEQYPDADITFLVIGEAANKIFSKPENEYLAKKVIRLTSWLEEKDFSKLTHRRLSKDEKVIIAAKSQPSTMATQAIMRQLPSYCLDKFKKLSYVATFYANSSGTLFNAEKKSEKLDKEEL